MKSKLLVFSGRASNSFARKIAKNLSIEMGRLEVIKFSDGELTVDIGDNVRGRDVFICQSTYTPGNEYLVELLIILDALKRASAGRITAVIPYFGYARQDRKNKSRAPITAKLMADIITVAGANRVLTLDLHAGQIMGFFDIPVDNLNALPVLVPYFKEKYDTSSITIVSPDAGGVERARAFASGLGSPDIAVIDKRRVEANKIAEMKVIGDVEGKVCLIVDDMIDTGGTLVKAAETVIKAGATKVIACGVHAVFSSNTPEKLIDSPFEEIVVTDTIPLKKAYKHPKIKVISVSNLIAQSIKRINNDESVSSLLEIS